ncbi:GDSL-type esterase/lipase family protein [Paenibacillus thermotolerans]|uniref:GDSL-type esterase/lipase family protein n=1 Tax=Paenibacillus thermotolerans TaxID=3027807 RepID=UPI0023685DC2|nr:MULTISPECIES: GDSL-type esterase/lipase family protein [unclassified Paenibacillus]
MRAKWRPIGAIALLCTVILLVGFGNAVRTVVFPQEGGLDRNANAAPEADQPKREGISIVAIGDSLTVGTGDESGKGYVVRAKELLGGTSNVPVRVLGNFARNGYTTTQVLAELNEREGIQEAIREADVVLMTAGGNDLFRIGDEVDPVSIREKFPEALNRLQSIMAKIKSLNADARVYYIGLYNPFIDLAQFEGSSDLIQEWNAEVFKLAEQYEGVTFVSTFDLFENGVSRFLSADFYHPNGAGYERIAKHIALLLE